LKPGGSAPSRGRHAEEIAASFLRLNGFSVLSRNRRACGGEIDLIAREGRTLVFVEVRMRAVGAWVSPAHSIDARKRARLRSCARALARRGEFCWPVRQLRFDVVCIEAGQGSLNLEHLRQVRI
jgi:putative endonuclease